jgi:choline dehydrogenase-like flavoprotein
VTNSSNGTVKVTGIEFAESADAKRQYVKIGQEAIIAAGSLHTPQLLQVSGIGDASLLRSIDVPTVVDLPAVGHNLHDHLSVSVVNTRKYALQSLAQILTMFLSEHHLVDQHPNNQHYLRRSSPSTVRH